MIIIIPLAGRGSRFSGAGFETPKPFIDVAGLPMLSRAFETVAALPYTRVVFVALAEHAERFQLEQLAGSLAGNRAQVVRIAEVTEGQLCTVLMAGDVLETDEDVLIASSDTLVVSDIGQAIAQRASTCRGLISVARLPGDHWSFVEVDEDGRAIRVAEKERISEFASTGLYYFSSAREFSAIAREMVAGSMKTRGEYYVIPVYQRYIDGGWQVGISEAESAWDMGNPSALRQFEAHLASR